MLSCTGPPRLALPTAAADVLAIFCLNKPTGGQAMLEPLREQMVRGAPSPYFAYIKSVNNKDTLYIQH